MPAEPVGPERYESIARLIKRAFLDARSTVDNAVRAEGVTATQWGVLNRLSDQPGLSGADLARLLSISPQATQGVLRALERRGLVERKPDPGHGKIVRSFLTVEGRHVTEAARSEVHAIGRRGMSGFSAQEQAQFTQLLQRYIANLSEGSGRPG